MKFGEYLRDRRTELGWTQPEAAAKVGIEQSYLSKLETGKSIPSGDVYQRFAEAYDLKTEDMVTVLFPAELDRLREVDTVREAILHQQNTLRSMSRRWLVGGLTMLLLSGALLGLSFLESDRTVLEYNYQSTGIIRAGEPLDVFDALDEDLNQTDEGYAEKVALRDALIARVDEQTRAISDMKGPRFIEQVPEGTRVWRLTGGFETLKPARFGWARVPGLALLFGGLGCFFISWRWP